MAERQMKGTTAGNRSKSQKATLIDLVEKSGAEVFHFEDTAYITFAHNGCRQTAKLHERRSRRYLQYLFFSEFHDAPASQAMQEAIGALEGKAFFQGDEKSVHMRVAGDGIHRTVIDLGTSDWSIADIRPGFWSVKEKSDIKFYRPATMIGYSAKPVGGGNLEELLRPFLNISTDDDWMLVVAFITCSMRPCRAYPVGSVNGEHGSAKSSFTKILRRCIDPSLAPLRSQPKEERDLAIAALNSHCLVFDNISTINSGISDALCGISTGRAFGTRTLYENTEETVINVVRPILLDGIEDFIKRSDLKDRSLFFYLPRIKTEKRISEAKFWKKFDEREPYIIGALFDLIAKAMELYPTETPPLPRMTEFAEWGIAVERAINWPEGSFLKAYHTNRNESTYISVESNLVASEVKRFVEDREKNLLEPWQGTATELLSVLDSRGTNLKKRKRAGPTMRAGYLTACEGRHPIF